MSALPTLLAGGLLPYLFPIHPAPGLLRSADKSRRLHCERLTPEAGSQRYPGEISAPRPRGDYVARSAVVCSEWVLRPGLRDPHSEAILATLQDRASAAASAVVALGADLGARRWLVEAHDPSVQVADKVRFATQNALAERGLRVSDRRPTLAAGDIDVITRQEPDAAYAMACRRYRDNGSLRDGDALLALVTRDPRETTLHAGLCLNGVWTWLR